MIRDGTLPALLETGPPQKALICPTRVPTSLTWGPPQKPEQWQDSAPEGRTRTHLRQKPCDTHDATCCCTTGGLVGLESPHSYNHNTLTHVPTPPRQDPILLWWLQRLHQPHCRKRSSTTRTPATEFHVLQPSRDAGVFRASGSGAALFTKMLGGMNRCCLSLSGFQRKNSAFFLFFWWIWTLKMSCPGPLETLPGIHRW